MTSRLKSIIKMLEILFIYFNEFVLVFKVFDVFFFSNLEVIIYKKKIHTFFSAKYFHNVNMHMYTQFLCVYLAV